MANLPVTMGHSQSWTGMIAIAAAATASGAIGFAYGGVFMGGLSHLWNNVLLPTFSLIYIYGVALCT